MGFGYFSGCHHAKGLPKWLLDIREIVWSDGGPYLFPEKSPVRMARSSIRGLSVSAVPKASPSRGHSATTWWGLEQMHHLSGGCHPFLVRRSRFPVSVRLSEPSQRTLTNSRVPSNKTSQWQGVKNSSAESIWTSKWLYWVIRDLGASHPAARRGSEGCR